MDTNTNPPIVKLDAFTVIGLEVVCPDDDNSAIGPLWDKFFGRIKELEGYKDFYGVCLPVDGSDTGFRYLACVTMNIDCEAPEGMVKVTVPAAKYAVYPFHDKVEEMKVVFGEIFSKLIPAAGLTVDPSHQCLEFYPHDCWDEETKKIKADLHIAVL